MIRNQDLRNIHIESGQIAIVNGEWHCFCGNDPSKDGFHPCDEMGRIDERLDAGNAPLFACGACGVVIESPTGKIVQPKEVDYRLQELATNINACRSEWIAKAEPDNTITVANEWRPTFAWQWKIDTKLVGNSNLDAAMRTFPIPTGDGGNNSQSMAVTIVQEMRRQLAERLEYVTDITQRMCNHIEATSATSPETVVGEWATVKGAEAYDAAQALVNEWRQR